MKIEKASFVISVPDVEKCPSTTYPEYAFIGRSNVGKSSLINMLCGRKGLAKTSSTPGKTLLINHFMINDDWQMVDLPGYGYAKRSKKEHERLQKLISGYILKREQMVCLFVLVDIRHDMQAIDLDFINWLGNNQVPFAIVFTKADKLSNTAQKAHVAKWLKALSAHWDTLPPSFITSSEKKTGRDDILNYIEQVNLSMAKGE